MLKIKVKVKNIYGNDLIYPLDFKNDLQNLTGAKTLSKKHIEALKNLGFTFEIITKNPVI